MTLRIPDYTCSTVCSNASTELTSSRGPRSCAIALQQLRPVFLQQRQALCPSSWPPTLSVLLPDSPTARPDPLNALTTPVATAFQLALILLQSYSRLV